MRTLRALSTLLLVVAAAELAASCASNRDDRSLGNSAGSAGRPGSGGSSSVILTGGSGGMGASSGSNATGSGGSAATSAGGDANAGAAGEDGSGTCTFSALGTCGGASLQAEPRTVNMLLVIDKSGSMVDSIGDEDKWTAMKSALAQSLGRVQAEMNFGLELFPYSLSETIPLSCDTDCCAMPDGDAAMVAPIRPGTEAASDIADQLAATSPGGGTPTAKALQNALAYFTTGEGAALTGQSYVLLATDGGPNCNPNISCKAETCTTNLDGTDCGASNCCSNADAHDQCLDDTAVNQALGDLLAAGIPTFVVGLPGTAQYATYLDDFARSGGMANTSGSTQYYAVSETQGVKGLVDVFDTITTELVRSCNIPLQEPPNNPNLVNVAIDCNVVPPMSADGSGWHYDDPNTPTEVILVGPVCDRLQANGAKRVDVLFGCPTVR